MASVASYYLRKLAIRDAEDYRVAYEKGEIGIPELREAAADARANETPQAGRSMDAPKANSAAQKGKGRTSGPTADSQVGTNYRGVCVLPAGPLRVANTSLRSRSATFRTQSSPSTPLPVSYYFIALF